MTTYDRIPLAIEKLQKLDHPVVKSPFLQKAVSAILLLATIATILSPKAAQLRVLTDYTAQVTFSLLAVGLIALVFAYSRIMTTALCCCAVMCIYLKGAGNENLRYATSTGQEQLHICQFNLSNVNQSYPDMLSKIKDEKPDVISFQEVDPNWAQVLKRDLLDAYPFSYCLPRIDPHGLAIFSKRKIEDSDVFYSGDVPHMTATIKVGDQATRLIASYVVPALDAISLERARLQLADITEWVADQSQPTIALGDYNMVYWTDDLRAFASQTSLVQSRRESSPVATDLPQEHIFFSRDLECVSFSHIYADNTYVGVHGKYQARPADVDYRAKLIGYRETAVTQ